LKKAFRFVVSLILFILFFFAFNSCIHTVPCEELQRWKGHTRKQITDVSGKPEFTFKDSTSKNLVITYKDYQKYSFFYINKNDTIYKVTCKDYNTPSAALCYSWDFALKGQPKFSGLNLDIISVHLISEIQHIIFGGSYTIAKVKFDLPSTKEVTPDITAYNLYIGYALCPNKHLEFPLTIGYYNINNGKSRTDNVSYGAGVLFKASPMPLAFGMQYNNFTGFGLLVGLGL
jgi:hypothetical protein